MYVEPPSRQDSDVDAAQYFFNPRMIDVSLVRGQTVHTGHGTIPFDSQPQSSSARPEEIHESSSDSESDDGGAGNSKIKKRSKGKGKKRKEPKNSGPWKLVLTYRSPTAP